MGVGHPRLARTLILDYYDSYTNNLLNLFTRLYPDDEVLRKVVVVKADRYSWDAFQRDILPSIDCIILSPGPGRPDNPSDIGFALDLIRLHPVPILGVCLGHQAICVAFGGKIVSTPRITHGHVILVSPVHPAKGLYATSAWELAGVEKRVMDGFEAVVYNSLTIDPKSFPAELDVTAWSSILPDQPQTIQGLVHKVHPIWGVQYHPESISSTQGRALISSFLSQVHRHHRSPALFPALPSRIVSPCVSQVDSTPSSGGSRLSNSENNFIWPTPPISPSGSNSSMDDQTKPLKRLSLVEHRYGVLGWDLPTSYVYESLVRSRKGKERAIGEVWLDGQTPSRPTTTSLAAPSFLITYSLSSRTISLYTPNLPVSKVTLTTQTFWDWFAEAQQSLSAPRAQCRRGWRGGWVGYFGYEMKEESLEGYWRKSPASRKDDVIEEVDACWAWCDWVLERDDKGGWAALGVSKDHQEPACQATTYPNQSAITLSRWLEDLAIRVGLSAQSFVNLVDDIEKILQSSFSNRTRSTPLFPPFHPILNGRDYRARIDASREAIRQGNSYELTLTTAFLATLPPHIPPYELYLHLRTFNPAFYSAFLSFPDMRTPRGTGIHVLSSSPERFLRIENMMNGDRCVEMMPIKGTRARVTPGQCICTAGRGCHGTAPGSVACEQDGNLEDERRGRELQADLKERAENLMIVDLIRSDLLSCCVPSSVSVPKLITLESYGVHNLVSTVVGTLASDIGSVDAVRKCFPPGSMTGAPKLRSVQLLEGFEDRRRRGVYSGALGYISVDGATDLSVVIRTIVVEGNSMSIGAGGAITWLSDREKEWDEVKTKVQSVVGPLHEDI